MNRYSKGRGLGKQVVVRLLNGWHYNFKTVIVLVDKVQSMAWGFQNRDGRNLGGFGF